METISLRDREILRKIAYRKVALANSARNDEILAMWYAQAKGVRDTPPVRLLFSNFEGEVITPRLRCEGKDARKLEAQLLKSLVGRELFDDDTPLNTTFDVNLFTKVSPFGTPPNIIYSKDTSGGYHIEPLTDDIEADMNIFENGYFSVDRLGTEAWCAYADEAFGDILPSRIVMPNLKGAITNPLVKLIGMETYYLSMYDSPEALHVIMEMATSVYER